MAVNLAEKDLVDVWGHFQKCNLLPKSVPKALEKQFKTVHLHTFSLILWRFQLRKEPDCGKIFLNEVASDAIQILPHCLSGYVKTTSLLIRGIVENVLRHAYFMDHPIEFQKMNRPQKWYLGLDDLFKYCLDHPKLRPAEKKYPALGKLKGLYDDLSGTVHGRSVKHMEMRRPL